VDEIKQNKMERKNQNVFGVETVFFFTHETFPMLYI
jgi:hypothetical protein